MVDHQLVSQLLRYKDSILTKLGEESIADSKYLDFANTFDKGEHKILLPKAKNLNVKGEILTWIRKFPETMQAGS